MTQTLAALLALAAASGPPTTSPAPAPGAALARLCRNPAAEARLLGRLAADPDRRNPGWGAGWPRVATFGGAAFDPAAQHTHPGLPPAAANRLPIGASYRLEHWGKGTDPASRVGWSLKLPR